MSDEQFKNQMEALAVKKLDKPKKLAVECLKYWKEIVTRQYNFDRGEDNFCVGEKYFFPASGGLFSVVFAEVTGARKRDLCPGSKRSLIQPPSVVVDDAYKTHAPCIVC